jgi:hypothetical protein
MNGLGASDLRRGFGDVYNGRKKVAHVSYNGRVWGLDGKEILCRVCEREDGTHEDRCAIGFDEKAGGDDGMV